MVGGAAGTAGVSSGISSTALSITLSSQELYNCVSVIQNSAPASGISAPWLIICQLPSSIILPPHQGHLCNGDSFFVFIHIIKHWFEVLPYCRRTFCLDGDTVLHQKEAVSTEYSTPVRSMAYWCEDPKSTVHISELNLPP